MYVYIYKANIVHITISVYIVYLIFLFSNCNIYFVYFIIILFVFKYFIMHNIEIKMYGLFVCFCSYFCLWFNIQNNYFFFNIFNVKSFQTLMVMQFYSIDSKEFVI